MKDAEQDLLADALEALDGLELTAGKLGPATFEQKLVRKLKLAVAKRRSAKGDRGADD